MHIQKTTRNSGKSAVAHENHCADCEKDISALKKDLASLVKENDSLKKDLDAIKKQLKELADKPAPAPAASGKDPRVDKILKVLKSNGSFRIKYSAPD